MVFCDKDEVRSLYDEQRLLTGELLRKGEAVPKGRYYNTVVVWIENNRGELLLQLNKKYNLWSTTGGHPKYGEDSLTGIQTEVKEELGVDIPKRNFQLLKTLKTEDDFLDIYYAKYDIPIKKFKVQDAEVGDIKWASTDEISSMISDNLFLPPHIEYFDVYMKFKNAKKQV
jgi:isopentenyldiphosphate isomerase